MNVERQIIGSLLIDGNRINDFEFINSEMFSDGVMSLIFALYEHNKGINQYSVVEALTTDYRPSGDASDFVLALVDEHDPAISDRYCAEKIYNNYRVRKLDEMLSHIKLSTSNIDQTLDDLREIVDSLSKPITESDIATLSDLTSLKDNYFKERPDRKDLSFGFEKIDNAIGGIDDGDVGIIAARPAVGKSALALQLIRRFGRKNLKVGYFNLEMSKEQVYERAVASSSKLPMERIRRGIRFLNNEQEKFAAGNKVLATEKNVYVIQGSQSIKSIRTIQNKYKFDVVVIDYLQLIIPGGGRKGNRVAEVGDISRGLKAIATDFKIPVIALSQLNRSSERADDKEPYMSDLRESGDIEQDASFIVLLWNSNPKDKKERGIKVEKARNGHTTSSTIYFKGETLTFFDSEESMNNEKYTQEAVNDGFVDVKEMDDLPFK